MAPFSERRHRSVVAKSLSIRPAQQGGKVVPLYEPGDPVSRKKVERNEGSKDEQSYREDAYLPPFILIMPCRYFANRRKKAAAKHTI